jgi:alpha-L-fucosidase
MHFDVDALINQLVDANADYFGFTLGQNNGYYNAPNPVFDELTGYKPAERCSKRDLPMEIAKACKKHGIKFILYLPCQPANRDAHAEEAIGFPATPPNSDRHFTMPGAQNWAKVIEYWAKHYGDLVDGWWFDGGYEWIGFRDKHAQLYSQAVKSGNPNAVATFNPGVKLVRATQFEGLHGRRNQRSVYGQGRRTLDGRLAKPHPDIHGKYVGKTRLPFQGRTMDPLAEGNHRRRMPSDH